MTLLIPPDFHKTGTIWLQEQLFIDRRLFNMMFDHRTIFGLIVNPHDFHFDPQYAREAMDARRSAHGAGLVDVLSSEILCGTGLTGQRDDKVIADRLVAITGPAKILLTVRAQAPILKSIYMQYVKRGAQ